MHGKSRAERKLNLKSFLVQLQKYDLHLNVSKYSFFESRIEFLGHTIQFNKIQDFKNANTQMRRGYPSFPWYSYVVFKTHAQCFNTTNDCCTKSQFLNGRLIVKIHSADWKIKLQTTVYLCPLIQNWWFSSHRDSGSLTTYRRWWGKTYCNCLEVFIAGWTKFFAIRPRIVVRIFHQDSAHLQLYAAFLSGYNYDVTNASEENICSDCFPRAPIDTGMNYQNSIDREVHSVCSSTVNQINSI